MRKSKCLFSMMLVPNIPHNGSVVWQVIQEATAPTRMDIEVNQEMLEVHHHTAFFKHSPVRWRMATSQTLISIFLAHSCIESWEDTPYESNRLRKRGYKFSSKVYFEFQYRSNNQIVNIMGYVKMKFHREILTNMLLIGS